MRDSGRGNEVKKEVSGRGWEREKDKGMVLERDDEQTSRQIDIQEARDEVMEIEREQKKEGRREGETD